MKRVGFFAGLALMLVISVTTVFAGGGKQPGSASGGGSTTLRITHDKTGAPDYHPYFLKAGDELKAAIGLALEPVGYPSTDVYTAAIRSALPTSSAPDLFTWWAGAWTVDLQKSGLLTPVTAIWEKYKDEYSPGIREMFAVDGQLYSLPWSIEYWLVYYNKEVYSQLGLQPPASWDEFLSNCQKIKAAGKTPLNQTIVDEWPAFITFEEIAASIDPNLYNDLCTGKKKFTDPQAVEIFTIWKDWIDKGWFTDPSTNYFSDMPRLFNDNQLAMIVSGTWYVKSNLLDLGVPESKIGFFFLKTRDGKNRAILEPSPILVPKNTANLENSLKAVDYFMSAKGNTFLSKQVGGFPVNSRADASYLDSMKQAIQKTVVDGNFTLVTRFWENMPTELMLQVNQKFQEFIVNSTSPQVITADIQKLCDAYFK
ncbi:MAG: ABC transporter substrate-binding protein [Treponema sp.]|jgi:multiple sugar transport system substrate-binding protein/raffinose/stachyose/melibiose transport system substrate-binding protein|nr:ABC transporter substrate-binding protein [Treponema sp.]